MSDFRSGYWIAWHIAAYSIINIKDSRSRKYEKEFLARRIGMDIIHFPCEICRPHAMEYLRNNPFKPYIESSEPDSMFDWVLKFHNTVNRRLNKKEFTKLEALDKYKEECKECKIINQIPEVKMVGY